MAGVARGVSPAPSGGAYNPSVMGGTATRRCMAVHFGPAQNTAKACPPRRATAAWACHPRHEILARPATCRLSIFVDTPGGADL